MTSTLVTATREKVIETAEIADITKIVKTTKTSKIDEDDERSEYLKINFAQVLYIQYLITFWKKSVLTLLDLSNEVNTIYPTFLLRN